MVAFDMPTKTLKISAFAFLTSYARHHLFPSSSSLRSLLWNDVCAEKDKAKNDVACVVLQDFDLENSDKAWFESVGISISCV